MSEPALNAAFAPRHGNSGSATKAVKRDLISSSRRKDSVWSDCGCTEMETGIRAPLAGLISRKPLKETATPTIKSDEQRNVTAACLHLPAALPASCFR